MALVTTSPTAKTRASIVDGVEVGGGGEGGDRAAAHRRALVVEHDRRRVVFDRVDVASGEIVQELDGRYEPGVALAVAVGAQSGV